MKYFGFVAGLVAASLFVACEQPKDDKAKEPAETPATETPATETPATETPATETPAEDGAAADEEALPEKDAAPSEEPAPVEDEAAPADAAPAEETAPAEEPVATDEDQEPTDEPAAMEEEAVEETISVSPEVADDAPSEPSKGEPAFENQPQPVYPGGEPGAESEADMSSEATMKADEEPAGEDVMVEEGDAVVEAPEGAAMMEEDTMVVSPKVSEDAPSKPHEGEPPFDNQPEPVYPDGEPAP